jgi:hypothetical protein
MKAFARAPRTGANLLSDFKTSLLSDKVARAGSGYRQQVGAERHIPNA